MAVEKIAPQGYVGTPEAAQLPGVTQQTIRNRIRAETLRGKEVRYPDGERRYYVERPSLDLELSRRGQVARYENMAEYSQTLADHFTHQAKMLRDVMEAQNAEYSRRLENMEHNQKDIAAKLNEAVDILRESAEREKRFQEDVLDLLARYAQQVTCPDHDARSWRFSTPPRGLSARFALRATPSARMLRRLVRFLPFGRLPAMHEAPLPEAAGFDARSGAAGRLAESRPQGGVLKEEAEGRNVLTSCRRQRADERRRQPERANCVESSL